MIKEESLKKMPLNEFKIYWQEKIQNPDDEEKLLKKKSSKP